MADHDQVLTVYITCTDLDEARHIAHRLVEERLAAGANYRQLDTVYWWEGVLVEGTEATVTAHTTRGAYDALEARVQSLSSYVVPCLVAWPVEKGLPAYLASVRQETRRM